MRRKPAPNPLSLSDDSDSVGERSAANANTTLTFPDPTALEIDRSSPRPTLASESSLHVVSSTSSRSPKSPRSPLSKFNLAKTAQAHADTYQLPPQLPDEAHIAQHRQHEGPHYADPGFPSLNAAPPPSHAPSAYSTTSARSARENEKHSRSASRFFNFSTKVTRSANQLHHSHSESTSMDEVISRGAENPVISDKASSKHSKNSDLSSVDPPNQKSAPSLPSRSDVSLVSTNEQDSNTPRKNKPKPFALLGRNRSLKDNKDEHSPKDQVTIKLNEAEGDTSVVGMQPLKTAPMNPDGYERSFRHMMNSGARNHSADRAPRDAPGHKEHRNDKDRDRGHPSSYKDSNGSAFFAGLKNSGSRAADMISKGLFGRGVRSASTTERDAVDDEHYLLKVINLPLVEQTRLTRISKRLEDSRDKTEFWMPAFPWRAIDYLNLKGTEVEGLYRVPGSGPQIKKWQRKFDEEYDVDLFAQDDLYDINIIGSMFKAWLRELPDELFPKEAQERIARECAGAERVPQLLIDELSNLSPFNYYLLFAITCHLSLLLAHSEKNKMDFRNLCICFQPCMKIDAFCFKFLVCNWRSCWQGCKNEAKYIEEEYMLFRQPIPRGLSSDLRNQVGGETQEDRNLSSSDSSKLSAPPVEQRHGKVRRKPLASGHSNGSMASNYSTASTSLTVNSEQETPRQRTGERDLRPLSPIKPLSPMNFS
ncbi:hypothetical protein GGS23DRAFT_615085 [Durotheca rogersii]|uniref:uncharacterized protein n=1 Tax=Durotheca rogersii TaxID=419775 RepID=UPI00221F8017|nr:uncharacterized protein GGS23DRAFT_615085 [Durotheca rogersii]KAI5866556.1 hypothetical protein GGS23DRAFT_615085 [Durotheca rogersii]